LQSGLAGHISTPTLSFGPVLNYSGLDDIPGSKGNYWIPPDTMGAVGITRTLDILNNNNRVQSQSDGATIGAVTMEDFWSASGGAGFFDPSSFHDPYNNCFIVVAVSNSMSTTSSIEIGISNSGDPWSTFTHKCLPACSVSHACGAGITDWYTDYPAVGFNKNWIAISVNMLANSNNSLQ
jgi:hypothetical protein